MVKNISFNFQSLAVLIMHFLGLLIIIFSLYLFFFHNIKFNPLNPNLEFLTFSDSQDSNIECSKVDTFKINKDQISLSYIIGDKIQFPYIGFTIRPKDQRKWNCNLYDKVTISVDSKHTNNFSVLLFNHVKGFSSPEQNISWRIFEKDFTMNESGKFTLPLNQFITPIWWFGSNNIQENGDRSSLSTMGEIHIQSHPLSPKNKILRLTFKEIKFSHSFTHILPILIIGLLLILLSFWIQIKNKVKTPLYKPLNLDNRTDKEHECLSQYLANEYSSPDLTLNNTSLKTGISEKQIRYILKHFYKMSFKEYLTSIRMKESKRLLLESDRNISEISNLIGYKHPTTFTRIFRETFGESPKVFRDKNV